MTINVVIPTYKNVKGLTASLVLLNQQTELPDLVTIINTSGSEEIDEVITAYSDRLTVRRINESPCMIYKAWNLGIKEPMDLNWIINDDTLFPRQSIEILKRCAEYSPEVYCWCPDTPNSAFNSDIIEPSFGFNYDCTIAVENIEPTKWMSGFSFCLTAECIKNVPPFNESYKVWFGDTEMEKRILHGHSIMKINGFKVYHFGGKSYSYQSEETKQKIEEDRIIYQEVLKELNAKS